MTIFVHRVARSRGTSDGLLTAPSTPGRLLLGSRRRARDAERLARARAPRNRDRNAITRLHREHYGRGATTTRTVFQRNHVVAFLEDIYTALERTLINADDWDQVKATRQSFQMAMRGPFSEAVEEITGRKVIAFMSQVHLDPDMAAEIFVRGRGSPGRAPEATRAAEAPGAPPTAAPSSSTRSPHSATQRDERMAARRDSKSYPPLWRTPLTKKVGVPLTPLRTPLRKSSRTRAA